MVKGEDIRYWYYEEKYDGYGGSLNGSCMKHKKCQHYFGIYVENPEVCQLLILKSHVDDKIIDTSKLKGLSIDKITSEVTDNFHKNTKIENRN